MCWQQKSVHGTLTREAVHTIIIIKHCWLRVSTMSQTNVAYIVQQPGHVGQTRASKVKEPGVQSSTYSPQYIPVKYLWLPCVHEEAVTVLSSSRQKPSCTGFCQGSVQVMWRFAHMYPKNSQMWDTASNQKKGYKSEKLGKEVYMYMEQMGDASRLKCKHLIFPSKTKIRGRLRSAWRMTQWQPNLFSTYPNLSVTSEIRNLPAIYSGVGSLCDK